MKFMSPRWAAGVEAVLVVGLVLLSSTWCRRAHERVGLTYDEPLYLAESRQARLERNVGRLMQHGTMPLALDLQSWWPVQTITAPVTPPTDYILQAAPLARSANLVFWWVLLGYVWLLTRRLAGATAAAIACGLVAFDPNLLAHAALATTDVALAAMMMACVYHTWSSPRTGIVRSVLIPAVALAAAILAKLSGLLFGTLAIIVIEAVRLFDFPQQAVRVNRWSIGRAVVRVIVLTLLRLVLALGFVIAYCGIDSQPDRTITKLRQLANDDPNPLTQFAARHAEAMPNAVVAFVFQSVQNRTGRGTYLLGEWHPQPVWYYFPVTLAMKWPDVGWGLILLVLVRRPQALANWPLLLAVVLLASTLTARLQLGIRLILPVVVLLDVAVAVAVVRAFPRIGLWLGVLAVGLMAVIAARSWPHGLMYLNQLSGGSRRTADRLADSNADWGQGIPELIRWHDVHNRPALAVWYYGTDPRAYRPAFRTVAVQHLPITSIADLKANLGPTFLAVGLSQLSTEPHDSPTKTLIVAWLRRQVPVARVATFLIFDVRATTD